MLPSTQLFQTKLGLTKGHYLGLWLALAVLCVLLRLQFSETLALLVFIIMSCIGWGCYWVDQHALGFSLTQTHMQQHCIRGGWVLAWKDIEKIDICYYQIQSWQTDIPWVGVKIKTPTVLLSQINQRLMAQMILHQRQLLYLGLKQAGRLDEFQDLLLKDTPITEAGQTYKGLQAMFLHRMRILRQVWGYDIFISAADIPLDKESFVGTCRRYLVANYHAQ